TNPGLRLAGDSVGRGSVEVVEHLCANYPDARFLVTMLSRENQHELCVAARKFRNLHVFGCWWFLNNPSLIDEITRMRLELLGLSVTPQHSDARVLDQLVYKWAHSRAIIADVLADKYIDLAAAGWRATEDEIRRDVAELFGGNFWTFVR
ncbi:MAG: glucuronate isomerase, partial [Armatimonadota bacterium]